MTNTVGGLERVSDEEARAIRAKAKAAAMLIADMMDDDREMMAALLYLAASFTASGILVPWTKGQRTMKECEALVGDTVEAFRLTIEQELKSVADMATRKGLVKWN